jgi:hypothetical protein
LPVGSYNFKVAGQKRDEFALVNYVRVGVFEPTREGKVRSLLFFKVDQKLTTSSIGRPL